MLAARMRLRTEPHRTQKARWPKAGRHILAHFDAGEVVVYQAYSREIGRFAAEQGFFGGAFSYDRMSWIKPNFLWMMYRSGWGTKPDQEITLAVHLRREAFDHILAEAVHSSYVAEVYGSREAWQARVGRSQVRLQWDPDHAPGGAKLERRAIQLGLRGDVLCRYGREWIVAVEDVSDFVAEQRAHVRAHDLDRLVTPAEDVYPVTSPEVVARLGLAAWPQSG
jgi:hypothetical protein